MTLVGAFSVAIVFVPWHSAADERRGSGNGGASHGGRPDICEGTDCDRVFVDVSKNGTRRFCPASCQNRVKAAASRLRRAAAAGWRRRAGQLAFATPAALPGTSYGSGDGDDSYLGGQHVVGRDNKRLGRRVCGRRACGRTSHRLPAAAGEIYLRNKARIDRRN
jgi:hypothetical protein